MVVGYDVLLADAQLVHSPVYYHPLRLAFVGTCCGPLGCPSRRCPVLFNQYQNHAGFLSDVRSDIMSNVMSDIMSHTKI